MKLGYLHISDLHLAGPAAETGVSPAEQFEQDMVTASMLQAIEELVEAGVSLDMIFITGDLARRGRAQDYQVVEIFCDRLLDVTGVPRNRLYLVPGNHDVDRRKVLESHIRWWYRFEHQSEITEVLTSTDALPVLMRKLTAFNEFAERVMGRRVYDESTYYMVESVPVAEDDDTLLINLVGLNSALYSGYDNDDKGRLALGLFQVERALRQVDKNLPLTIAFFHHPPLCLHPEDRVSLNIVMSQADLILTGHLHEPTSAFVRNAAGQAAIISAGASFEKRDSANSFNLVDIDLRTGKGRLQFFKYLPALHRWVKNRDANPNHEEGIFALEIEKIRQSQSPIVHGAAEIMHEPAGAHHPSVAAEIDLLDAVYGVLLDQGRALHYKEIAQLIRDHYPALQETGDVPKKVYARVMREIKKSESAQTTGRFSKVAPGVFMVVPERAGIQLTAGGRDRDFYYRLPQQGHRFIPLGTRLAVPDGWTAVVGSYGCRLATLDAGVHVLGTGALDLQSPPYQLLDEYSVAFQAFVQFVRTGRFQFRWGTAEPIPVPDETLTVATIRGFGQATLQIADPLQFAAEMQTTDTYRIASYMRAIFVSAFMQLVSQNYTSMRDLPRLYRDAGRMRELVTPDASRFGFDVIDVRVQSISFGEDTQKRIAEWK